MKWSKEGPTGERTEHERTTPQQGGIIAPASVLERWRQSDRRMANLAGNNAIRRHRLGLPTLASALA